MLNIPNMVMIGGNSRNAGKTTLACRIISKFAASNKVIAFKVTSIRPGEEDMHGNHNEAVPFSGYSITEELNPHSDKDTSKMLKAGADRVFYIRAEDDFVEQAILDFMNQYNKNQPLICESRSMRDFFTPGLFLMMMRLPAVGTAKDVTQYLSKADHISYNFENQDEAEQLIERLNFNKGKFLLL
jgi:hypothetical protein